ncbi:MAG TPA: pyruvate dehydrogenase complex dihydrolipoamide acetyltransferase [Longimicrobium sp.]|nr:pyruvate dehydrogenase complex dihydrolipoamide acetyltransferase [Longimicrobium sp.]
MATKVYMEALSPTMEEGRLATWLKNEGDQVKEGDVLAEVETDKATMELVARGSGVLRKRMIAEGDTANVGTVIAVIAGADEDVSALTGGAEAAASQNKGGEPAAATQQQAQAAAGGGDVGQGTAAVAAAGPTEQDQAERAPRGEATPRGAAPTPTPDQGTQAPSSGDRSVAPAGGEGVDASAGANGRVKASPLARKMASEAGMQLGGVQGSGPGGRIVKRDVEAAMTGGGAQAQAPAQPADAAAPAAEAPAQAPAAAPAPAGGYRDQPLSQMRKTIAKRLTQSIGPVPHFFLTVEVDMGEAVKLRARINDRFKEQGVKVSPNDLVIKAVAAALRKHPWVNAAWTGDAIRFHDFVHIGVAVAVDEGLITPVIKDADRKGVAEIAAEVRELAGRAREKKLKPDEYTGSTFSISNLGMFGIEEFTAVINPPEAAILAVGAIGPKVVVDDEGNMAVRQRMRVTLSCDHRVIDGATGAQFLATLKSYLEEPMLMVA